MLEILAALSLCALKLCQYFNGPGLESTEGPDPERLEKQDPDLVGLNHSGSTALILRKL
jgi:hypothetical protein